MGGYEQSGHKYSATVSCQQEGKNTKRRDNRYHPPNRNCKSPLNGPSSSSGGTKEWKVNPLINQFQSGADNFFCRIYDCLQLFPVPSPPFLLASDRIHGTQSTSSTIIIGRNGDTYLVSITFLTVRSLGRPRYQLRQKASSVKPSLSEPHHPYCSFTPNVALLIN